MKLIWPLVSSTAHSTSSMCAICALSLACAASSSSVMRLRRRFRSIVFPSLDEHDGIALENRPSAGEAEGAVGEEHGHHRHRPTGEHRAGHREVVLGHSLLDQVAEHDEQDQVEGLQGRELPAPDRAGHEPDEDEEDDCADDDVHQGQTVIVRSMVASSSSPS